MTAPKMIWAYPELYICVPTDEEPVPENATLYTRSDLCIRRDDPVLVQVMEAAVPFSQPVIRNGVCVDFRGITSEQVFALRTAIAAMRELIGGTNGQTD